jgi:hypothetical protein
MWNLVLEGITALLDVVFRAEDEQDVHALGLHFVTSTLFISSAGTTFGNHTFPFYLSLVHVLLAISHGSHVAIH